MPGIPFCCSAPWVDIEAPHGHVSSRLQDGFPRGPAAHHLYFDSESFEVAFTDQTPSRRAGPGSAHTTSSWLCSQSTSLLSTRVLARSYQEECPFLPHQLGPLCIPSKQTFQIAKVHSLSSYLYLDHCQWMFFLRRTWPVSCPPSQDCVPAPGHSLASGLLPRPNSPSRPLCTKCSSRLLDLLLPLLAPDLTRCPHLPLIHHGEGNQTPTLRNRQQCRQLRHIQGSDTFQSTFSFFFFSYTFFFNQPVPTVIYLFP